MHVHVASLLASRVPGAMFSIFQSRCRAALASRRLTAREGKRIDSRAICLAACLWHVGSSAFAWFLGACLALVRSGASPVPQCNRVHPDSSTPLPQPSIQAPARGARAWRVARGLSKRRRQTWVARMSTRLHAQLTHAMLARPRGSRVRVADIYTLATPLYKPAQRLFTLLSIPSRSGPVKVWFRTCSTHKHTGQTNKIRTHPDRVSQKNPKP